MKILLVITGGTIGSTTTNSTIDVDNESSDRLLKMYKDTYGENTDFTVIQPVNLLSENSSFESLNVLCNIMLSIDYDSYDGVIVTHGSDTLSYTSSLLGMLLAFVKKPIVIIAANYPIDDKRSNGLINLHSAVAVITSKKANGVFTVFGYENEHTVYLSTRICEADPYCDRFSAFGGAPLGYTANDKFIINNNKISPTIQELNNKNERLFDTIKLHNSIMLIRPYPNMDYNAVDLSRKPAAILHYLYHSGTACTTGGTKNFLGFAKLCNDKGIPLYIGSCKHGDIGYITAKEMEKLKVQKLYNISMESAYMKLCLAYNQSCISPCELMSKNLFFEYLP